MDNDKEEQERLTNKMKSFMDRKCIGWKEIVKREMAKKSNKYSDSQSESDFDEFTKEPSKPVYIETKPYDMELDEYKMEPKQEHMDLVEKYATKSKVSSIREILSDEEEVIAPEEYDALKNQTRQLKAYMGQMTNLIERAIKTIDEMEQ